MVKAFVKLVPRVPQYSLLPFLYCTRSILSTSNRAFHTHTRLDAESEEHRASRSDNHSPYIPFERKPDSYSELELDGSTITPNERKAFESLFKLQRATVKDGKTAVQKQAGDRTKKIPVQEEDTATLDTILDTALGKIDRDGRRSSALPAALRPMALKARAERRQREPEPDTDEPDPRAVRKKRINAAYEAVAVKNELRDVQIAIEAAQTDVEVWQVLQDRVLKRVVALKLNKSGSEATESPLQITDKDSQSELVAAPAQEVINSAEDASASTGKEAILRDKELDTLSTTLPIHLTNAFTHLSQYYPASSLALALLSTLKTLGPTAFAMGISTKLYNQHMRLHWRTYTDPHYLCSIMEEMDAQVYEFNDHTWKVLDDALIEGAEGMRGLKGPGLKAWFGAAGMRAGMRSVAGWKKVVESRMMEEEVKRAREREKARREGAVVEEV